MSAPAQVVTLNGAVYIPTFETYQNGGVAIQLVDLDFYPCLTATSWLPGLEEGEVAVKDYSENTGMLEALVEAKIVSPAHRSLFSGCCEFPVCQLLV